MTAQSMEMETVTITKSDLHVDEAMEDKLRIFWKKFVIRLFLITIALTIIAVGTVSYFALNQFQKKMTPEFQKQAAVVGQTVASQLGRAFVAGIPLKDFYGMEDYLDGFLKANPAISYIVITDIKGKKLFGRGNGQATAEGLLVPLLPKKKAPAPMLSNIAPSPTEAPVAPTTAVESTIAVGDPAASAQAQVQPQVQPAPVVQNIVIPKPGADKPDEITSTLVSGFYDTPLWLRQGNEIVARLHVGVDEKTIAQQNYELMFDVVIVTLVALLVAFEFILFTIAFAIMLPTGMMFKMLAAGRDGDYSWILPPASGEFGRISGQLNNITRRVNQKVQEIREDAGELASLDIQGQISDKLRVVVQNAQSKLTLIGKTGPKQIWDTSLIFSRTPLFLFVFAQEMCRPFFPNYVSSVFKAPDWYPSLTLQTAISLPLSLAMLIAALMTPVSGIMSDRFGRRMIFVFGALISATGLVLSGTATDFMQLISWWCLSAVGYGMVFIACQSYVLDNTTAAGRAQGMAIYLGAIIAGDICGPAIGGVLADRIGFAGSFYFAASMTFAAAYLAFRYMVEAPAHSKLDRKLPQMKDFVLLLRNRKLLSLLMFASMPGKILLTGFLFYLTPLFLASLGNGDAIIGRVLMCFGLAALFVTPVVGSMFKTQRSSILAVGTAVMIQGAALLFLIVRPDTIGMVISITIFGIGQAIATSLQPGLVPTLAPAETQRLGNAAALGVYRLIERMGTVIGPLLVALLLANFSQVNTFAILGAVMAGCGAMFMTTLAVERNRGGGSKGGDAVRQGSAS